MNLGKNKFLLQELVRQKCFCYTVFCPEIMVVLYADMEIKSKRSLAAQKRGKIC